jgi:hypothetical protein
MHFFGAKGIAIASNSILQCSKVQCRVSYKTSFDSKHPKLVSALSETKRLFKLFRFYIETVIFVVSIKPKLTKTSRNKPLSCPWTCLFYSCQEFSCLPGGAQFTKPFLFVSVFFETGLFVSVFSIRVQNTGTNRNKPKN